MTDTPPRSLLKQLINKVSEKVKRCFGLKRFPDHPPFVPPNVPQHLGTQTPPQNTQSLPVLPVPTSHQSGITSKSTTTTNTAASGVHLVGVDTPALILGEAGSSSRASAAQTAKILVKGTLGLLSSAAGGIPIPGVKGIFDTMIKVISIIETTKTNQEGFAALKNRCQSLIVNITDPLQGKASSDIPPELVDSLNGLEGDLKNILANIENKLESSKFNCVLMHEEYAIIIKDMNDRISQFMEYYSVNINIWTAMTVHQIQQAGRKPIKTNLVEKLTPATAGFDYRSSESRSSCFQGTRERLLTDINNWMHNSAKDESIYILYGIAGIGKSTVAQTVAMHAAGRNLLLGSFFFSRAMDDCKSGDHFFATLAFQSACYHADLAAQITQALEDVPDILHKTLDLQCKKLIVEPIQRANIAQNPLILVIDALDECLASDASIILEILAKYVQHMSNVKIFITTRPESYIQQIQDLQTPLQAFYLHEIETSIAKGDIELFLKYAL
ncbi:hypothetical protein BDZ94DRAFT_1198701, partial [Collybia nuda]